MKNGTCSKCGKREVRCSPPGRVSHADFVSVTTFRSARLRVYVCTACGWVERWMQDQDDLARIAEKWERPK